MPKLSEDFLYELKIRNPIESVVGSYVDLKRAGSNVRGLCPFHGEKTPSFTVYPESDSFYCFGCNTGGSTVNFIMNIENLDFFEAVKFLCERSNLTFPEFSYDDSGEKLRRNIFEINKEAAKYYYKCLLEPQGEDALNYLLNVRKFTPATIKKFGLGFAPDSSYSLLNHLKGKGFYESDMLQAKVINKSQKNASVYDFFRKRIMFPIFDVRGNIIAFTGREMQGEKTGRKYINTSDSMVFKKTRILYAMNFAKNSKEKYIILAEGNPDAIALHQAGFDNAVASGGTALTKEQALLIKSYKDEVMVIPDTDSAGQNAAYKSINTLTEAGLKIRVLELPAGKDVDEYIKESGADSFKALIGGANNSIEFELLRIKSKYDLTTQDGRINCYRGIIPVLSKQTEQIYIDVYAGQIAEELKIDKKTILDDIKKTKIKNSKTASKKAFADIIRIPQQTAMRENINKRILTAEEIIIASLIKKPEKYLNIKTKISAANFRSSLNKRIFEAVSDILDKGREFDITYLSGEFQPDEMGAVVRISQKKTALDNIDTQINDCIGVLMEKNDKINTNGMDDDTFLKMFNNISDKKRKDVKL